MEKKDCCYAKASTTYSEGVIIQCTKHMAIIQDQNPISSVKLYNRDLVIKPFSWRPTNTRQRTEKAQLSDKINDKCQRFGFFNDIFLVYHSLGNCFYKQMAKQKKGLKPDE